MNIFTLLFGLVTILITSNSGDQLCNFEEENRIWMTCGNKNVTETDCVNVHKCCVPPDEFLKRKNLTEKCLKVHIGPGVKYGSCEHYNGSVCSKYFQNITQSNTSLTTLRSIDNEIGTSRIDIVFKKFFHTLEKRLVSKDECLDILSLGVCQYGLPLCFDDNTPQQPCKEDCEYVMNTCKDDFSKLLGAIEYIAIDERIDVSHLAILDSCSTFEYSYEIDPESNKTCAYWFDSIDRTPPTDPEKSKTATIAVASAAALLSVAFIAIICFLRKMSRKKKYEKNDSDDIGTTMTSIRDRIRQDSYVNPLLELLASSKPGELVQYPLDCVEYIRDLGEGQFGKVFQGRVHEVVKGEESTDVAVKCLKEGSSSNAVDEFHKEVALMSVLQHANILCLLAVSTEEEPYCMIFEFMENGDLNEFLRKWNGKEYLNDNELIKICKQVAAGMEYLASKKFLHRDLATRNCLVGKDMIIKIADFGMSRNVYHSDYYRVAGEAMLPVRWMPPEAILYGKFTIAADVYSFGVVLWEIFSFALQPFYGYSNEEVVEFIKKGVLLPKPEDCPDWIYNIMLECWKHDREQRISFSQALRLLKGEFNYDQPTNRVSTSSSDEYEVVTTIPPQVDSTYDQVPRKTEHFSAVSNGSYQTVNAPTVTKPTWESNSAQLNAAYDNETSNDEPTKSLVSDAVPPDCCKRSSVPDIRKNVEKKVLASLRKSSEPAVLRRDLLAGRSIKDVLKDDARYVSSDKLQKAAEPAADSSAGYIHPSFRPSSEFLQFHGYGEDIQATDDDERNIIKKIIEGSHHNASEKK